MHKRNLLLGLVAAGMLTGSTSAVPYQLTTFGKTLHAACVSNYDIYDLGDSPELIPEHYKDNYYVTPQPSLTGFIGKDPIKCVVPRYLVASAPLTKALTTFLSSTDNSGKKIAANAAKSLGGSLGVTALLILADMLDQNKVNRRDGEADYRYDEGQKQGETAPSFGKRIASAISRNSAPFALSLGSGMLRATAAALYLSAQNNWNPMDLVKALKTPRASLKNFSQKHYTAEELAKFVTNTVLPVYIAYKEVEAPQRAEVWHQASAAVDVHTFGRPPYNQYSHDGIDLGGHRHGHENLQGMVPAGNQYRDLSHGRRDTPGAHDGEFTLGAEPALRVANATSGFAAYDIPMTNRPVAGNGHGRRRKAGHFSSPFSAQDPQQSDDSGTETDEDPF